MSLAVMFICTFFIIICYKIMLCTVCKMFFESGYWILWSLFKMLYILNKVLEKNNPVILQSCMNSTFSKADCDLKIRGLLLKESTAYTMIDNTKLRKRWECLHTAFFLLHNWFLKAEPIEQRPLWIWKSVKLCFTFQHLSSEKLEFSLYHMWS